MKLTDPVIGGGPRIQVDYVAFDSLGVKSMCTRVTTPEITLTIDPGASIQSASFPLPEPRRQALLEQYTQAYANSVGVSEAIVISHYHLDHFLYRRDADIYGDKVLFVKSPDDLPPKQVGRAEVFFRSIDGLPRETIWADGRRFKFKRTQVSFSRPVWHGRQHADPGTVIMTEVKRGREKVLISSDVAGPSERATTDIICASKAGTVVLDGYPTSHLGQFATDYELVRSIINVCRILAMPGLETLVIDHHMARDYRYPAFFKLAYAKARQLGRRFGTVAELTGRRSVILEAYQDYGATKWHRWAPLEEDDARKVLRKAIDEGNVEKRWLKDFDRYVA